MLKGTLEKIKIYKGRKSNVKVGDFAVGVLQVARLDTEEILRLKSFRQLKLRDMVFISEGGFWFLKTSPVVRIERITKYSILFRTESSLYRFTLQKGKK